MFLADHFVELLAMAALMAASGFFSCSEAALFSLSRAQRAGMGQGTEAQRRAAVLLSQPERLLTAILFWNLVINMAYFTLASVVSLRLAREADAGWAPQVMAFGSLAAIILMSELLPKNLGVLDPLRLSAAVARPLGGAVRAVDPLLPMLQSTSDAFARLLLPRLETEPPLALDDLQRAVEFRSGETLDSEQLLTQERMVLQRIVDLADTQVADLMRVRRRCLVMKPPVALDDLEGKTRGVGEYLLVTEPDSDEIAAAAPIDRLALVPPDHLERHAEPVVYVPWSSSAADTLSLLREKGLRVAAVINELGETIGIVSVERLLDAVLRDTTRPDPGDAHAAHLRQLRPGVWEATGATPLRRIGKRLAADLPPGARAGGADLIDLLDQARSRTAGGLVQELLERAPSMGDSVWCGDWQWTVVAGPDDPTDSDDAPLLVRIEWSPARYSVTPQEEEG